MARDTTRRRDTGELELVEEVVFLGARTFTLAHLNEHTELVVRVVEEGLRLSGRDGALHLMRAAMTPPVVSIPRERGATSRRRRSAVLSEV